MWWWWRYLLLCLQGVSPREQTVGGPYRKLAATWAAHFLSSAENHSCFPAPISQPSWHPHRLTLRKEIQEDVQDGYVAITLKTQCTCDYSVQPESTGWVLSLQYMSWHEVCSACCSQTDLENIWSRFTLSANGKCISEKSILRYGYSM